MTWIRWYKQKKHISKIWVDSNFTFSSFTWLCVFHCPHRLLCWIKSCQWDFLWKLLSFHTEAIGAYSFGENVVLRGELRKDAKNSNLENFENALYSKSGSILVPYSLQSRLRDRKYTAYVPYLIYACQTTLRLTINMTHILLLIDWGNLCGEMAALG